MAAKYDTIIDEIHDGLEHNVREVSESIVQNMAVSSAQDKKFVIIYYYNDDRISFHFKAISALNIFRDDFVFMAFYNPPMSVLESF